MAANRLRAAILVVSETAAQDPSSDTSGKGLRAVFGAEADDKWIVAETKIVGDNALEIQRSVVQWTDGEDPMNLVVTSGGTGFAVKDITPEVGSGSNLTYNCPISNSYSGNYSSAA